MIRRSKQHLVEAGETYFEHLSFAATVGLMALAGGLACLIHAIVPGLCTRTASRTIGLLNELLADRRRVAEIRGLCRADRGGSRHLLCAVDDRRARSPGGNLRRDRISASDNPAAQQPGA